MGGNDSSVFIVVLKAIMADVSTNGKNQYVISLLQYNV